LKKVSAGGLQDLTAVELKETAKAKSVSCNMTRQGVIDLLDELGPGVDHSGLKGKALITAKKHRIGPSRTSSSSSRHCRRPSARSWPRKPRRKVRKLLND